MSNRRSFLRNALMGIAVSLLPKVLQPSLPDVVEEEMQEVSINVSYHYVTYDGEKFIERLSETPVSSTFTINLPKSSANILEREMAIRNAPTL